MKKYKRIEIIIEAEQYWSMKKMDLPGFRNIIEKVLIPATMENKLICNEGEFTVEGLQVPLKPGDWVIDLGEGMYAVKSGEEFARDFIEI